MNTPETIIRACLAAYEKKDRSAIEALLAEDFTLYMDGSFKAAVDLKPA